MRVLSVNLGGRRDEQAVAELRLLFAAHSPDIICLQEVRWTSRDEPVTTAFRSEYSVVLSSSHKFNHDYGRGVFQDEELFEGLAVLSKYAFNATTVELPIQVGIDRWPRIAQVCAFNGFSLIHTHLSKYAASRAVEFPLLTADCIVGDLNAEADEVALAFPQYHSSAERTPLLTHPSSGKVLDYVLSRGQIQSAVVLPCFSDHSPLLVTLVGPQKRP